MDFQDKLAEVFVSELNYEYVGTQLPTPEIDGAENILNYSIEFEGKGISIIVVECEDRITEFQKKFIKNQKQHFPNAHFLFVSNDGKVFDLYNDATSKKLKRITYDEIGRNTRLFKEKLQLFDVTGAEDGTDLQINAEKAFDVNDKVTKNFFDKFKKVHDKLQKAITGIDDDKDRAWYASVMMNRIMFIYFLQKHYVIQKDADFLLNKFFEVEANGRDYYREFLLPLFFYGFARRENNPHKQEFVEQYGNVRYLNGGLFYPHHLEKKYTPKKAKAPLYGERAIQTSIGIDAKRLKEILEFLNGYTWYLDSRPMKEDTDINPDVLGFIFEKYINQKELGAYYTKEDITEYISKSTIIPFIFDKMKRKGFSAPDPTPLITENADLIVIVADYVDGIDNYDELKYLYKQVLLPLSVLDPSVGSGAFLFAALNILLPIYQKCVFKLKQYQKTEKDPWLAELLKTLSKHSEEYFLTKQIILNNLYGVDIVEEATEICKLRLFLQLASHLPDIESIEPLPDIDFNIYAGNSLVGGLSWDDLQDNYTMDIFTSSNRDIIRENIEQLSELKKQYRREQQRDEDEEGMRLLKENIATVDRELNKQITIGIANPFHWFIEFSDILTNGGFDVIIGNPPYVTYSKIKKQYEVLNYATEPCGDLYAFFIERSIKVVSPFGRIGMIVPISIVGTAGYTTLRRCINENSSVNWYSNYAMRPGKLFDKVDKRLTIWISSLEEKSKKCYSTKYNRWWSDRRDELFSKIKYLEVRSGALGLDSIPKISYSEELAIIESLSKHRPIGHSFTRTGKRMYHTRKLMNFVQFLDKAPYSINENDEKQYSTELKTIYFDNELYRDVALGVYNSSLFFWYYIAFSDCRNVNKREVETFPFEFAKISKEQLLEIATASRLLMTDLHKNAFLDKRTYKKYGTLKVLTFLPRLSKTLMDEVDYKLGAAIGLNDEQIRFLINYDLEFRIGEE